MLFPSGVMGKPEPLIGTLYTASAFAPLDSAVTVSERPPALAVAEVVIVVGPVPLILVRVAPLAMFAGMGSTVTDVAPLEALAATVTSCAPSSQAITRCELAATSAPPPTALDWKIRMPVIAAPAAVRYSAQDRPRLSASAMPAPPFLKTQLPRANVTVSFPVKPSPLPKLSAVMVPRSRSVPPPVAACENIPNSATLTDASNV